MRRFLKITPAVLLFVFLFIPSAEARADPLVITGGTVFIGGAPNSRNAWRAVSFDFSGDNFHVTGGSGDADIVQRPAGLCTFGGCPSGILVSAGSLVNSYGLGSATINGTKYFAWFFAGDTAMTFTGGSVLTPDTDASSVTLSTDFSMTGTLVIHDLFTDGHPIVFTSPITGQGIALMHFVQTRVGWTLADITYQFNTPSPEPATLVLLGTGLTGVAGLYRKRRRRGA